MKRAVDIVRTLFPNAKPDYVSAFDVGQSQLDVAGINTPIRLAHLLAQCSAETGRLTVTRESLFYTTEARLQKIFNNMSKTVPLFPGEVKMLLKHEHDLAERFYGMPVESGLYAANNMNNGINPGNAKKAHKLGNDRQGDGYNFRGNGLLQTTGGTAHRLAGASVGVDFFNHPELVTAPDHALKCMLFEWSTQGCNGYADADDVLKVSRAINLGKVNTTAMPNDYEVRKAELARAKGVLGI